MNMLLGSRGASAVAGLFMLALGSSEASAQAAPVSFDLAKTINSVSINQAAKPLGAVVGQAATMVRNAVASTTAVTLGNGTVVQGQPARSVTVSLPSAIAAEAAWLHRAGWPLYALVDKYSAGSTLDEQTNCLATAVYFEARGESLEGQLAVARVIMNRAASGQYPASWCAVVKQPAQFSFVRHGTFPAVKTASTAWARAQGITRLAMANVVPSLSTDVLWYHANYVAPSWGRRLNVDQKIGAHIFYRASSVL